MVELPDGTMLPLNEALLRYPHALLGDCVTTRFGNTLPFLLKILSVNREYGLSIQLHPTKSKAEELHQRAPQHYPDTNHKPEVGIALTPVSLLYGLKDREALSLVCASLPELERFLGGEVVTRLRGGDEGADGAVAKALFASCFALDHAQIEACNEYLARALPLATQLAEEFALFSRLSNKYGKGDSGLLAMLLMRQVHLAPGQAIFIAANVPHAYLEGDLIECMACSDNVVRAGLTPKYKDVETLVEVVDCSPSLGGVRTPVQGEGGFTVVETPTEEFLLQILPKSSSHTAIPASEFPVVVLCVGTSATVTSRATGRGIELLDGGAALLPPDTGTYEVVTSEAMLVSVTVGR
jgi:mannose-6-phosphate isomerase